MRSHAPIRCASSRGAAIRRYWADLHGQSGETVGMGSAEDYFRYARDAAFIDMVGHQGNDFQITDTFWTELNRLTAEFDEPGKFVCLPGYEWSGNTGMGGDRNVFFRREGRADPPLVAHPGSGADLDRRDLHRRQAVRLAEGRGLPRDRPCRWPLRRPALRP